MKLLKCCFVLFAVLLLVMPARAQRVTDPLDRGVVAVKVNSGVFVSWRMQADEYYDVRYNLYRNGSLIASNIYDTNYTDAGGTTTSTYSVAPVRSGTVGTRCTDVGTWTKQYMQISIADVVDRSGQTVWKQDGSVNLANYTINDISLGDVDGDGKIDFIVKRKNQTDQDELFPTSNTTRFCRIECYASSIDYAMLWWIDCGPNICYGSDEQWDAVAFDWNEDGACEVLYRGGANTVIHHADGTTETIGNASENIRSGIVHAGNYTFSNSGEEWLMLINGKTGNTYDVIEYPLPRGKASDWGDDYGHRSSKYFMGAPYLDGQNPYIFLGRGIYTKIDACTYRVNKSTNKLYKVGNTWHSYTNAGWHGQGNHNFSIADVDIDGADEIIYGSMVLDFHTDDSSLNGLSSTSLGHGDASHTGDLDPFRFGLETFACNEDNPGNNYRNATTCEIYSRTIAGNDDGRAMAGNFTNDYPGGIGASTSSGIIPLSYVQSSPYSPTYIDGMVNDWNGQTPYPMALNFRLYWDDDLLSETLNGPGSSEGYLFVDKLGSRIYDTGHGNYETACINGTKKNPCATGDILGDWREEIVMRTSDNKYIRVYTTVTPTTFRMPSLWYDHQYRQHMVWQTEGYNQPPHPSFFVGELEGLTQAPPALTWTGRSKDYNGELRGSLIGGKDVLIMSEGNGQQKNIKINSGAQPATLFVNSRTTIEGSDQTNYVESKHTFDRINFTGSGLSGPTNLCKQGSSAMQLPYVSHTHSGRTDVWQGALICAGSITNSNVWANIHTELFFGNALTETQSKYLGIEMEYGSALFITDNTVEIPTTIENGYAHLSVGYLTVKEGSRIVFDINGAGNASGDKMDITGFVSVRKRDWRYGPKYNAPVFQINSGEKLAAGDYELGSFTGTVTNGSLSSIVVEAPNGIDGTVAQIYVAGNKLKLHVGDSRVLDESGDPYGLSGNTYYIYNELQDKFLSRSGNDAYVDNFGLPIHFESSGNTYTLMQADNNLYYSGMYWTSATAAAENATAYSLTPVEGYENTYTFKNTTNPADDGNMYINMSTINRVANNSSKTNTPDLRNSYWKVVTAEERNAIIQARQNNAAFAAAQQAGTTATRYEQLALMKVEQDCTNKIPNTSFGLSAVNNVYEVYQGTANLTQTATGLNKGLYRITLPAFYRQGYYTNCVSQKENNMSIAYMQVGTNQVHLCDWARAYSGTNNPNTRAEAETKFNAGNYQNVAYAYVASDNGSLTIKIGCPINIASGWLAFGAIKLEKLNVTDLPLDVSGKTYYVYNELQDKFLSRSGNDAYVDNFGIAMTFEGETTYKLKQTDTGLYYSGMYWTTANAAEDAATSYRLDPVDGYDNTYTFANTTNPADDGNMYINVSTLYRVANNSSAVNTPDLRNSYWKLVTVEQRNEIIAKRQKAAIMAAATSASLVVTEKSELDALAVEADYSASIDRTFGLKAVNNVYEVYQGTANLSRTASALPKGLYRVTLPAFYRQGFSTTCIDNKDNNMSIAYMQINGNQVQLSDWASAYSGTNNPNTRAEAETKFNAGNYQNVTYFYQPETVADVDIKIGCPINVSGGWLAFAAIKIERIDLPNYATLGEQLKEAIDVAQYVADQYKDNVGTCAFLYPVSIYNELVKQIADANNLYNSGTLTEESFNAAKDALTSAVSAMQTAERNPIDPYKNYYLTLTNTDGTNSNLYMNMSVDGASKTLLSSTPFEVRLVASGNNYVITNPDNGHVIGAEYNVNSNWGTYGSETRLISNSQVFAIELQEDGTIRFASQNSSFRNWGWHLGGLSVAEGGEISCYKYKVTPVSDRWILTEAPALIGDVDVDHDVDMDDLRLLAKIVAGVEPQRSPADVNQDGHISIADLATLVKILLK